MAGEAYEVRRVSVTAEQAAQFQGRSVGSGSGTI